MATYHFNSNDVPPNSFEPIPSGKYLAIITESEFKTTKDEKGQYLALTFQITEGQYKGRKLWDRLNLENPSKKAMEIARGQLSAICRAIGVVELNDTGQLHDKEFAIRVAQREYEGDIQNDIKGYAHRDTIKQSTTPASAPKDDKGPAPWKR